MKLTVAIPPLVVRLREDFPPRSQTVMNSLTEATKNWDMVLAVIFTYGEPSLSDLLLTG